MFVTSISCQPRWLSRMRIRLVIRRLRVQPLHGRQHSFMEIGHEIFSMVILSLLLIQEGHVVSFWQKCARCWLTAYGPIPFRPRIPRFATD